MQLLKLNPGLSSRIPECNFYTFEDFGPQQLDEIALNFLSANNYKLTEEAARRLNALFETDYRNKRSDFGNGRHVMNVIKNLILKSMARRLSAIESPTLEQLTTIEAADIPTPLFKPQEYRRIGYRLGASS